MPLMQTPRDLTTLRSHNLLDPLSSHSQVFITFIFRPSVFNDFICYLTFSQKLLLKVVFSFSYNIISSYSFPFSNSSQVHPLYSLNFTFLLCLKTVNKTHHPEDRSTHEYKQGVPSMLANPPEHKACSGVVNTPSVAPLDKADIPSPSRYQLHGLISRFCIGICLA